MSVGSGRKIEVSSLPNKWQDREKGSSQKAKVWIEQKPTKTIEHKVAVIYYLSRDGQLEHPHFMVVPLSSSQGLYLKDVISRLCALRGQGMASMYSWSSKRSYKNGFVWQDLTESDFIYPCQGHEYILKGSQLLDTSLSFRSFETVSSFSSNSSSIFSRETNSSSEDFGAPTTNPNNNIRRSKNQSWSSFDDLREYQVYKARTAGDLAGKAMDASTQTDEKARSRRTKEDCEGNGGFTEVDGDRTVENARDFGRIKASTVLRQLIKCGSRKIKDYSESTKTKGSHNAV
ncbi:hypothetical protein UlMin_042192 [Ulmus minor]